MGFVVSAEMFNSHSGIETAADKEVLLTIAKNQQQALHSKSLFHMLLLFSWLLPSMGHYVLPLKTALLLLPDTAIPFSTQSACTDL